MKERDGIKKYHISVFTTNLFALVISILFMKSYVERGYSLINVCLFISLILSTFLLIGMLLLRNKVKRFFPDIRFIAVNSLISFVIAMLFFSYIGVIGTIFVMIFTFLLSETEHMIFEVV